AREDGTPGFQHIYLNLAIVNQALGPSTQDNARLGICATYYDDPALVGAQFRPEVYQSDRNGVTTLAFTPGNIAVTLQGIDRWREAYFELPDVKFYGVNQGPQAAARFYVSQKVFFSRMRYAVIRPCGPFAGVNRLSECKQPTLHVDYQAAGKTLTLSWTKDVEGWTLEATDDLSAPDWQPVADAPTIVDERWVVQLNALGRSQYYRLRN